MSRDKQLSDTRSPLTEALGRVRPVSTHMPRIVGTVVYAVAILNVASGLTHGFRGRAHWLGTLMPWGVGNLAAAGMVVFGILLALLGHGLKRRKLRAWRAAVPLTIAATVLDAVHSRLGIAIASGLLLYLLLRHRDEFYAAGDPTTRWRALWTGVGLFVGSTLIGLGMLSWYDREVIGGWPGIWLALQQVWLGMIGVSGDLAFRQGRFEDFISDVLLGLGVVTVLVPIVLALRSPSPLPHLSQEDEAALREMLPAAPDSLGYFNLRRDKSVLWSDSRKAAVAYRVVGGVMLASGDPIGDPEAWPGAMTNFLLEADRHAWVPAALGCSERAGRAWQRVTDFAAVELGDEAVVDIETFSLSGRSMRNVRQMVSRVRRAGYETRILRVRDMTPTARGELLRDAEAWRGSETERGFSMALGRVADPRDPDALIVLAVHEGVVRGFLQFVPWGSDGISLDLMRRDRNAEPGINELLIVSVLEAARDLGIHRVSLNFAAFRSVFERAERLGAGPVTRFMRRLLGLGSRWFQLESLYRFNSKFHPRWIGRFLVYPSGTLPRVALAALRAEAFVTRPSLPRLLARKDA
ncbi:MAG TPA: phosphatidylglycerol lysyltransferase domain-containing protein [Intrasporangium sp.]|nr:phosphatidylglycerol lysyltransferase domain-containing protein [Intrasporangium sp.]